jgi:hypothetical protein
MNQLRRVTSSLRSENCDLQCDEALLGALLNDVDTHLKTIATALDLLAEVLHHLLKLINHSADGGISGIRGFGAAREVMWIWLHGSRYPIPDC